MKNIMKLALGIILGLGSQVHAMEQAEHYLHVENKTNDTLKVSIGLDDTIPLDLIIAAGQTEALPFTDTITQFSICTQGHITWQTFGMEAPNHTGCLQAALLKGGHESLAATITPAPQADGIWGRVGSYFAPYEVLVESTQNQKYDTMFDFSRKTKPLDCFKHAKTTLELNKEAPISCSLLLGLDSQANPAMIKARFEQFYRQWMRLKALAPEEHQAFMKKVIMILDKTKALIQLETRPELLGRAFAAKTGLVPKDLDVRKTFEAEVGKGLAPLIKQKLTAEIRALLLEDGE